MGIIIAMILSMIPMNSFAAEQVEYDVNLALGKTVEVSTTSTDEPTLIASNITDGNANTRWKSKDNDKGTVTIDLGSTFDFNEITINWEGAYGKNYNLQVSTDKATWQTVATINNTSSGLKKHKFNSINARYVKLVNNEFSSSATFISIFEIEVHKRRVLPADQAMNNIIPSVSSIIGGFNADQTIFDINVGNETSTITLTPILAGSSAIALVNGKSVTSGVASEPVELDVGLNPIQVVTADPNDADNSMVYTVNVHRKNYNFNGEQYTNIALNKNVTALKADNSNLTSFWNALRNVNNGNKGDFAQPNLGKDTPWQVKIDLQGSFIVDRFDYYPFKGQYPYDYSIKTSVDGTTWTTVVMDGNTQGEDKTYVISPTTARYVMFSSTKATGFSGIAEMEVYGVSFSLDMLLNVINSMTLQYGQSELSLPSVPDGYNISIKNSSDTNVITTDGNVTFPAAEQVIDITIEVLDQNTAETAEKTIQVTVPAAASVETVETVTNIEVENGTAAALVLAQLPQTAELTLNNGKIVDAAITWAANSIPTYDAYTAGQYTFAGEVVLPYGVNNDHNKSLTVEANVTVKQLTLSHLIIKPGNQTVTVPASDFVRRKFIAEVMSSAGIIIPSEKVEWSISSKPEGVSLDNSGMLVVDSTAQSNQLTITATSLTDETLSASVTVTINKKEDVRDFPANPLEKDGWILDFHDEFDEPKLNKDVWYDGYLTHWANTMESSATNYMLKDGKFILFIDETNVEWSVEDNGNKATGMQSFEKNGLHKWGSHVIPRQDVEDFDGYATKYGYYEIRTKLPGTGFGGHLAWWMVGTQDDAPADDIMGESTKQNAEIDIMEIPYGEILKANPSTYPIIHKWNDPDAPKVWFNSYGLSPNSDSEYHTFAMDWTPTSLNFYYDNKLVAEGNTSPSYRMMTFFSMYAGAEGYWTGKDNGVYPKDWFIDYFRVYKKDEPASDLNLAALSTSEGDIDYKNGTITYAMDVSETTESITVTPTGNTDLQTIAVNGETVESGTESQAIPLAMGVNKVKVMVTAGNGDYKYHTLTINRVDPNAQTDKTALIEEITKAQLAYDSAVEGNQPGQYPATAMEALSEAIVAAAVVVNDNSATQEIINIAFETLSTKLSEFKNSVNKAPDSGSGNGSNNGNNEGNTNNNGDLIIKVEDVNGFTTSRTMSEVLNAERVIIQTEQMGLEVTQETMNQLSQLLSNEELLTSKFNLSINKQNPTEEHRTLDSVTDSNKADAKLLGSIMDLDLTIRRQDGTSIQVAPIIVSIPLNDIVQDQNTALYRILEDGKLEYLGGKVVDGQLVVQLHQNGTYALLKVTKQYNDISSEHWATEAIEELTKRLVINGTSGNTFNPSGNVTRAEFVTMLIRAIQFNNTGKLSFDDVTSGIWYEDSVKSAVEAGIVQGYTNSSFRPQAHITREEMVAMLIRAYQAVGKDIAPSSDHAISDANDIAPWAKDYVAQAYDLQLVQGSQPGKFVPKGLTTRAEAAVVIYNLLKQLGI